MFQFTPEQINSFAHKPNYQKIHDYLTEKIKVVDGHFLIPPSKAATWSGFYACPHHSVTLEFDIASPKKHRCPVDGELIEGEIYDGAWWRIVNDVNEQTAHYAALLYLLDHDPAHLELAKNYLIEYAKVYPGYEVHGGIPYNNPGKANAQTLCDAGWIKGLLFAYDIIKEELPAQDQTLIEENLFRSCGEFLMEYRSDQIHNHEMVVNTAIAMIGLLLNDTTMIEFGITKPYGMQYQIENGLLLDDFWFEGSVAYHYYMIQQVIFFEMFAKNTEYSFFKNPRFIGALKFPLNMLQPNLSFPLLNDSGFGYTGLAGLANIYELAYQVTQDENILELLRCVYLHQERNNIYAYFFGVDKIDKTPLPVSHEYIPPKKDGSGLTTLEGPDGRYLLFKHSPFGGEHDHYDRLGIHYVIDGCEIIPDIGTSLYGAPMHYSYYKNTASHSTVNLNGENQPPANCVLNHFEKNDMVTIVDSSVTWDGSYVPMNSHVIPQWNDDVYQNATLRRIIAWYGTFFIDIYTVETPDERTIDYTLHMRGEPIRKENATAIDTPWSTEGASRYIHSAEKIAKKDILKSKWKDSGNNTLEILTLHAQDSENFYAIGPDNPSTKNLGYYIQRVIGTKALFINVISSYKNDVPIIKNISSQLKGNLLQVNLQTTNDEEHTFSYML